MLLVLRYVGNHRKYRSMLGRRAFARGSGLWSRAFNNDLPRRMASVCFVVPSMKSLAEKPLNGWPEQYRLVNEIGLIGAETPGEVCEDSDDNSATLSEIMNAVASLRSLGILRNYMTFSTTQHPA